MGNPRGVCREMRSQVYRIAAEWSRRFIGLGKCWRGCPRHANRQRMVGRVFCRGLLRLPLRFMRRQVDRDGPYCKDSAAAFLSSHRAAAFLHRTEKTGDARDSDWLPLTRSLTWAPAVGGGHRALSLCAGIPGTSRRAPREGCRRTPAQLNGEQQTPACPSPLRIC